MRRWAAWLLTKVFRRRQRPAARPDRARAARLLADCLLESRGMPGGAVLGPFATGLAALAGRNSLAGEASLIERPAPFGVVSSGLAGTAQSSPSGSATAAAGTVEFSALRTGAVAAAHAGCRPVPQPPGGRANGPALAKTGRADDPLGTDFAARLMDFWDADPLAAWPPAGAGLADSASAANRGGAGAAPAGVPAPASSEPATPAAAARAGGSEVGSPDLAMAEAEAALAGRGATASGAPRRHDPAHHVTGQHRPAHHPGGHNPHRHKGRLAGVDPNISAAEGTYLFNVTVASFSDSDGNTNAALYTATITWGDGQSSAGMVSGFNPFTVSGSHTYTEAGSYTVTVSIQDSDGSTYTITSSATITDAALSWMSGSNPTLTWSNTAPASPSITTPSAQTSAEGASVSLQVQASDPNHYTLTYDAVDLPVGLSINSGTGLITGTVDYAAAEDFGGSYSPTVIVDNNHGGSASTSFNWTVTDTPRAPVLTNPGNQSNAQGQTVSLQVSVTDPDGNALNYSATGLPAGLSIDGSSGLISGTIDTAAAGSSPYSVTVTAADSNSSMSQTFTWTVTAVNLSPQLVNPGNQTNAAGDSVALALSAGDADGDALTWTASGLPAGLTIDPSSGTIAGTIANSAASATPYAVRVTASDGVLSSSQTIQWTVGYVGVSNPGSQSNANGDSVSLAMSAVDATGGTLTYSASGLPPGLSINSTTGLISGTISNTADSGSPYTTTVTAADGTHSGSTSFAWAVAHVSLANPGTQTGREGNAVSLQLAGHDADGDSLTYSAVGLPPGLSLNSSTGLISGTPAAGAHGASPYQVAVTVRDGTHSATQTFSWSVAPQVVLPPPAAQGNIPGDTVALSVTATSVAGRPLTYTASGLPPGLSINTATGLISGTISSTAAAALPYSVTVTASDGTYSSSQTFPWAVSAVFVASPGAPSNTTGDSVSLAITARAASGHALTYSAVGLPPGLSINSSTGLISGTVGLSADSASPYTVTVAASDGTHAGSRTFVWTVTGALTLTNPGTQSNANGDAVTLQLFAADPDRDALTFSASHLPAGLGINASTGLISGTISSSADSGSPYSVSVTASDGTHTASQIFTWNVAHVSLTNPGSQSGVEGRAVTLQLSGRDADGDTLTYSATGLPSGLSINSSTGLISGTPAAGTGRSAPYQVTVTASDGTHTATQTFAWTIAPRVVVTNPGTQSSGDGASVSLAISATDAGGAALTYSATGLPSGLSINSSTGVISGTVGNTADSGSPYTVMVTATDGTYSGSATFTWTVTHVALVNPGPQTSAAGKTISLPMQGRDADNDTLSYTAGGLPPGLSINSSTGVISGTLSNTADTASPYTVTVTASDGNGHSASQTFSWAVTPRIALVNPGSQSNTDGDSVSLSLGATDSVGAALSYTATGLPAGLSINGTTGVISGTVSSTANSGRPYTVTVTASDGTVSASQTFQWTVSPAITLTLPGNQGNVAGDAVSLPITATDGTGGTPTFSATGLPAGLSISSATGLLSGTIATGADSGSPYTVTVTATDGAQSASATFTWAVAHLKLANPGNQNSQEGAVIALQLTGRDADGDTLTYSAVNLPTGLSLNSSTGLISGTIAAGASANSPYAMVVTVTDSGGHSASQAFAWAVSHVQLANPGSQSSSDGQAVLLALSAIDPDGDALTYSATGLPSGLTINSSTGLISGTISGTADGSSPYTVTVTASDGTHQASQTLTWTVAPAPALSISDQGNQSNTNRDAVSVGMTATNPFGTVLTWSATGLPPGLSINTSTGVISGTVGNSADSGSPYTVTLTATDGVHSATDTFTWTVAHLSLVNPGNQGSAAGVPASLGLQASDPDGDTVTFSATGLPQGLSINSTTGVISGTPAAGVTGNSLVTVTASDGSHSVSQHFVWTVGEVAVANPGSQTSTEGNAVSLQLRGSGPVGAVLTFSAGSLPPGLGINSNTGLISGTIAAGAAAAGPYTVTVAVSDGTTSSSQSLSWTVNPRVSLAAPADQTSGEGRPVALLVTATDAGGAALSYSAGGLPPGLTMNANTGLIVGIITPGAAVQSPYLVTVTATDGTYSTSQTFTWAVTPAIAPGAPVLSNPGTQSSTAGEEVSVQAQATSPGGYPLTYGATGLPDGLSIDPFAGSITGTIADDAASGTAHSVTVTVANNQGGTASQTFLWYVAAAPLSAQGVPVSATEGNDTGTVTVATFTTPDLNSQAGDFTATVTWGDGNIDTGSVQGGNGSFTVADDHTYAEKGTYPITVVIGASNGAAATVYTTATVADAALTLTGGFELGVLKQQSATLTVATFTDANPAAPSTDYSATVNWGDGSSAGPVSVGTAGNGLFTVVGTHSYAQTGTYTVTVTVTDKDGASATTTSTIAAGDVYAGEPATLTVSPFRDVNTSAPATDFTATVNWGDGNTTTGIQLTGSNGNFTLPSLTHTYAVDSLGQPGGVYSVTVTITDDDGNTLIGTGTVMVLRPGMSLVVANTVAAPPNLTLTNVEVANFTEPDTSDTTAEFGATIYWGDGTSGSGTITGSAGMFKVLGTHTYPAAKDYLVDVLVSQGWTQFLNAAEGSGKDDAAPAAVQVIGPSAVPGYGRYQFRVDLPPGTQRASMN